MILETAVFSIRPGEAKLFRDTFAKALQTQFAHGGIDTQQFIDFAKQRSGFTGVDLTKLDDYFHQWLYGTTRPTINGAIQIACSVPSTR